MPDPRAERMAHLLVNYSTRIQTGDRVLIEAEPVAEPLVRAVFQCILEAGGHPHLAISLSGLTYKSGLDDIFLDHASAEQIDFVPTFYQLAYENFESRIRIWSLSNTKAHSNVKRKLLARRGKALAPIVASQFARGDRGEFRWVTTLFPTEAYAQDAEMNLSEFEDLVYRACHVDDPQGDPIAYWLQVQQEQQKVVDALTGHDEVVVRGPNCDLTFSIQGRKFINSCGRRNMPDGEVFTGPVEESVNGWVRFTIPSVSRGNEVEGVEFKFAHGRVVEAMAEKNQSFLESMLETDRGARYMGEFAIGNNYGIERPTRNILFDEKIGGTIHIAIGAGYPKTGSVNKSAIHWDFITDMRDGGEILVDGDLVYQGGHFRV
ncbi:MAG: aminopeptidase [Anaerolineales bacterium]|nr:aminopeptidase [Anaerolineales bacterium]